MVRLLLEAVAVAVADGVVDTTAVLRVVEGVAAAAWVTGAYVEVGTEMVSTEAMAEEEGELCLGGHRAEAVAAKRKAATADLVNCILMVVDDGQITFVILVLIRLFSLLVGSCRGICNE